MFAALRTLFCVFAFALSFGAQAFEPLNTDDAATIGRNVNQIEQYIYVLNNKNAEDISVVNSNGEEFKGLGRATAAPFTYTRGLSETVEASFASTYYANPNGNYSPLSNYVLGLKWRFWGDGEKGWAFAVKPTITLPASTSQQAVGIGFASTNYEVNLISSYYWDQIHIHSNLSYARNPYNTNFPVSGSVEPLRTNTYAFSVAPVWVVNARWRLALDFGVGSNILLNANRFSDYGMVAAIYSITPDLDLGVSIMRSAANFGTVFSGSGIYSLRSEAGVTWRF
ncbi:MAG: hypothetical protein NBV55_05660 [Polynucleobacter sp.]|nr:hypothetical protein [Polynucleobacter sp.]